MQRPPSITKQQFFPPELRTASIVPRWSVVWTLTRDTVANHSFYVMFYAEGVANAVEWLFTQPDKMRSALCYIGLLYLARVHDLDETITGDIVSPVKAEILDDERYEQYVSAKMQERLPAIHRSILEFEQLMGDDYVAQAWAIIKAADRLDALLFLIGEQRMGNGVIAPRIPSAEARLKSAWLALPGKTEDELQALWHTVMLPVIEAHRTGGGSGV